MYRHAIISKNRKYRYSLSRIWYIHKPIVCFIMLNPSIADAKIDDPTIRRCIGFAKTWGFGGLCVVNLFAYRATVPKELKHIKNPIGEKNDKHILKAVDSSVYTILAWGVNGTFMDRDQAVIKLLNGCDYRVLGKTKNGIPKHPLYLKSNLKPVYYD